MQKIISKSILFFTCFFAAETQGQNPIVKNMGVNDPHIHIFNDTAYLYASHDRSLESKAFVMDDWWVWSSPDLVNWTYRSTLRPEDTYIGKPFDKCWATDAARKNGKYYFYFSEANEQTGVVVGETPIGPWKDVLGKPLLDSILTPTHEYDMAVFENQGQHYIIFGVWDYYIARLNDDMVSLAEKPRKILIKNPRGPYNPDGKNVSMPTDDKPFMHQFNGKFYLSWGVFYAMADNVYGPYKYKGAIMNQQSFAPGYDKPTWPYGFLQGRHGSFFQWNNQWYFAYCDISQTGNRFFRDTFISYIHYKENGEMATIRVDGTGVGNYNAGNGKIEAEDYFKGFGVEIKEKAMGFEVRTISSLSYIGFPNVHGLAGKRKILLAASSKNKMPFMIELRKDSPFGSIISAFNFKKSPSIKISPNHEFSLPELADEETIFFVIKSEAGDVISLDSFTFLN